MKQIGLCLGLAVLCAAAAPGQTGIWHNYTSMKDVRSVAASGGVVWAATGGGLFSWDAATGTFHRFTTAEGLLSVDLTAVTADAHGTIWAGTSGGILHSYTPANGALGTLLDIANLTNQTDKSVNGLIVEGDTLLICTNFGMSMFDIAGAQFGDTYTKFGTLGSTTRVAVFSAALFGGQIWATISDGQVNNRIASASLSNPNRQLPDAWTVQTIGSIGVVPVTLTIFNGRLYTGTSAGIFEYDGSTWNQIAGTASSSIVATSATQDTLYAVNAGKQLLALDNQNNVFVSPQFPYTPTSVTVIAPTGRPVIGSLAGGALMLNGTWTSHLPPGPNTSQFLSVTVDPDGVVWAGTGVNNGQGLLRFDGKNWTVYTTANSLLPANDVYRVSVGCNGDLWASIYGAGIVQIPHGSLVIDSAHVYGQNVGMIGVPGSPTYIATSDVICDSHGDSWLTVINPSNQTPLAIRRSDGSWVILPVKIGSGRALNLMNLGIDRSLALDAYDDVWMTVRDNAFVGVISLGNAGQIADSAVIHLGQTDGLPSDMVNTIVTDQDGSIWVGTDKGIGIILNPQNPKASGGIAQYMPLLGNTINTIAVDPLNQKWVGTPEGVVLLSPDGTQALANYTVAGTNGKLINDDVKSIAVDPQSGTVYFATLEGLASLTTPAVAPKSSFDKLTVYPNPYRIPNPVPLTVDGLVQNSRLKILSIDGRLIRDLETPGGRVGYWDGKDTDGSFVPTGVYLVVGYSEDGSETATGKVAVVRK